MIPYDYDHVLDSGDDICDVCGCHLDVDYTCICDWGAQLTELGPEARLSWIMAPWGGQS